MKICAIFSSGFLVFILLIGTLKNIQVVAFGNEIDLFTNLLYRFRITEDFLLVDLIDGMLNSERSTLHEMGYDFINKSYLLGIGFGNTVHEFLGVNYKSLSNLHSLYLTNLLEGGVFFAAYFILLLIKYLYKALKI